MTELLGALVAWLAILGLVLAVLAVPLTIAGHFAVKAWHAWKRAQWDARRQPYDEGYAAACRVIARANGERAAYDDLRELLS